MRLWGAEADYYPSPSRSLGPSPGPSPVTVCRLADYDMRIDVRRPYITWLRIT
jgi:hypothetical protein